MNEFVAVYIAPHLAKYAIAVDSRLAPFQDSRGRVLVRLKKALYGCVQSSRLWYETMSETLHAAGFRANDYDRCLVHKGERGDQISICLHVDDLLVTSTSQRRTDELLSALRARFREVKVRQGAENGYLGMRLTTAEDKLTVDMVAYIDKCLKECPSTATHATPADSNLFVVGESVELGAKEKEYFHSVVARLLYLAKRTRPDILTAVSFLTGRVTKSCEDDMVNLERVLGYLRKTRYLTMTFKRGLQSPSLAAYTDAGYGVHEEGQSRSGLVVTINGTPRHLEVLQAVHRYQEQH